MARPVFLTLLLLGLFSEIRGSTIVVANKCSHPVWVGTNGQRDGTGHQSSNPGKGGFLLNSGESRDLSVEVGWVGRLWGRTNCDASGQCETGDCGGRIECQGPGAPPATLAELTMNGWGGLDYYDVSLVEGGNLRMRMKPRDGDCKESSCTHDMTQDCPTELQMVIDGRVVACDSQNGSPTFREYVSRVCPNAYGFWDDDNKTYTCQSSATGTSTIDVTFC